jgi:peptidoglycan/LPS O-acetylase OafA/YrhL
MVFALVWDETNKAMFYGGFTAMAVVCAAIILAVAEGGWRALPFFELRVMRLFGRVSYGLYLWHVFALWAVGNELRSEPRATRAAVALAVTAGLTTGSWLLIEKPFLKLKDRWSTDRRLAPAPASGPAPESA